MKENYVVNTQRNVYETMLVMLGHYESVQEVKRILKDNPFAVISYSDLQNIINKSSNNNPK